MTILDSSKDEDDRPTRTFGTLSDDEDDDFLSLVGGGGGGQPPGPPLTNDEDDSPRDISQELPRADKVFRSVVRVIGLLVLLLTGAIGLFLGYQAVPTFQHYGWDFIFTSAWDPSVDAIGMAGAIIGTIEVALVALVIGVPLALLAALFTSQYCPVKLKSTVVSVIDVMAAVPSVIFGIWAYSQLEKDDTVGLNIARWLSQHFSWIPILDTTSDPNAAYVPLSDYYGSVFIAGIVVGIMIVPTACSVMRGVFDLAPIGEREAAYALGSTKWGMIRSVVLPFGRGGIIGGTMLALGRALGETVAVLLVITVVVEGNFRILESGTITISSRIANSFGEATGRQLTALLAAGFILFVMTLAVNTVAAIIVSRSRSGAGTDA